MYEADDDGETGGISSTQSWNCLAGIQQDSEFPPHQHSAHRGGCRSHQGSVATNGTASGCALPLSLGCKASGAVR